MPQIEQEPPPPPLVDSLGKNELQNADLSPIFGENMIKTVATLLCATALTPSIAHGKPPDHELTTCSSHCSPPSPKKKTYRPAPYQSIHAPQRRSPSPTTPSLQIKHNASCLQRKHRKLSCDHPTHNSPLLPSTAAPESVIDNLRLRVFPANSQSELPKQHKVSKTTPRNKAKLGSLR